jgi:hypothetical protein
MIRHLAKLVWHRKRANALLVLEIFTSFLVVFAVGARRLLRRQLASPPRFCLQGRSEAPKSRHRRTQTVRRAGSSGSGAARLLAEVWGMPRSWLRRGGAAVLWRAMNGSTSGKSAATASRRRWPRHAGGGRGAPARRDRRPFLHPRRRGPAVPPDVPRFSVDVMTAVNAE